MVWLAFAALAVALAVTALYFVWIVRTAMKKRWLLLAALLVAPVLAVAALIGLGMSHKQYTDALYCGDDFYGASVALPKPTFAYDSHDSFHGDGFSIAVYPLPPEIRQRFSAKDASFQKDYPKAPSIRGPDWQTQHWRPTPPAPEYEKYVEFALSSGDLDNASGLADLFRTVREALARQGNFYAFVCKDGKYVPGNIDFFLVDLKGNRLILINHNT
jgi:hypothetical protein